MRKFIFFLLLSMLACATAYAEPGEKREARKAQKDSLKAAEMVGAHRKGTKIQLDGILLTPEQQALLLSNIDSVDYNEDWSDFRKQRRLGNGLAIGGSVLVAGGAACGVVSLVYVFAGLLGIVFTAGQGDVQPIMDTAGYWALGGVIAVGAGMGTMAVGIPIRVMADKKMKTTCESYNNATERVEKSIILGTTASGIGLSFNF